MVRITKGYGAVVAASGWEATWRQGVANLRRGWAGTGSRSSRRHLAWERRPRAGTLVISASNCRLATYAMSQCHSDTSSNLCSGPLSGEPEPTTEWVFSCIAIHRTGSERNTSGPERRHFAGLRPSDALSRQHAGAPALVPTLTTALLRRLSSVRTRHGLCHLPLAGCDWVPALLVADLPRWEMTKLSPPCKPSPGTGGRPDYDHARPGGAAKAATRPSRVCCLASTVGWRLRAWRAFEVSGPMLAVLSCGNFLRSAGKSKRA
jgi:hypothetical protein